MKSPARYRAGRAKQHNHARNVKPLSPSEESGAGSARFLVRPVSPALQEKVPREFFINYSKEATLGQELRMVGCRKGGEYLMEGLGPEGVCFSAQCVF